MTSLLKNNRFYILLASIVSSLLIFRGVQTYIPVGELQIIRLEQLYAFVSMIFLYLALLAGPFCYTFPNFPFKKEFLHARRAIGVSAFYFAMLHGLIAFFGQLGGFHGLVFFDFKYLFTLIIGFLALIILAILALTSFDIHAGHKLLAEQALQNQFSQSGNPALVGDKTLRYNVLLTGQDAVQPNQDTTLHFQVYNASTGTPVNLFKIVYAKPMHLIIVNNNLTYFNHIHPVQNGNEFVITTQFPTSDMYRLYIDFQPFGAIEQQFAFSVPVGLAQNQTISVPVDKIDVKPQIVDGYEISLSTHGDLIASEMTLGQQIVTLNVKNSTTGKPVTTLKPYLASFGHLVMIREEDYSYIHVHPSSFIAVPDTATGGPSVDFLPIGIYGLFKPGLYKIFVELNPDGNLVTAQFAVQVK